MLKKLVKSKKKPKKVFLREIEVLKENPFENWTFTKTLGKGATGSVRLYSNKGNYVAIKEFHNDDDGDMEFQEELDAFRMLLDHENVVKFVAAFQTMDGMRIVLEYCAKGDLSKIWRKLRKYDENLVRDVIIQLVSGLQFMYENKIAHRDIKPENILVKSWDPVHVLVGDLNYAKSFGGGDLGRTTVFTTKLGTRGYRAPEILSDSLKTHISNEEVAYNHKCDIWSLGVILYQLLSANEKPYRPTLGELLSLRETFANELDLQFQAAQLEFRRVLDNEIGFVPVIQWNKVSDQGRNLVRQMLMNVPAERIDYHEILEHPWRKVDLSERGEIFDKSEYENVQQSQLARLFEAFRIDVAEAQVWMFDHDYYG